VRNSTTAPAIAREPRHRVAGYQGWIEELRQIIAPAHECREPRNVIMEAALRNDMLAAIPKLRAFAMSLCRNRDQADDLVQEALLRSCAKISLFEPGTNMAAWLFTILRNQFYTECRKRRLFEPVEDYAETLVETPVHYARTEYVDLRAALAKLRAEERDVLMLVGASGFSYGEAAKICGCPEGTVKSRVHRARARLAELLSLGTVDDFRPGKASPRHIPAEDLFAQQV
jgi:RNA polymerase sigma-70 factor (ECF subfamily)